jgi:hypothetical protein
MPRFNKDPKEILKAILKEQNRTGIRSKYPYYYLWIEDRLLIYWHMEVLYKPCYYSDSPYVVNKEVIPHLNVRGIDYFVRNIYINMGAAKSIEIFRYGSSYQGLLKNERLLIRWGETTASPISEDDAEVLKA